MTVIWLMPQYKNAAGDISPFYHFNDFLIKWIKLQIDFRFKQITKYHSKPRPNGWPFEDDIFKCILSRICTRIYNQIPHMLFNVTTHQRRSLWWRHQMDTFFALLTIYAGNSPVPGEFPTQRPAKRSFDVFFDLRLNKRLSKQWWGWWFETLSRPLWHHRNAKWWFW